MTILHPATTLAASSVPPAGAIACLAAVAVMLILDRIPLSAYRPRTDDTRTPRRRRRCRRVRVEAEQAWDEPPATATTVRRVDRPAIPARPTHRRDELEGR